jgi:protein required for attachment to host cells
MIDTRITHGTWIVVCDGGKALLLENAGDSVALKLRTEECLEQPHEPDRELGTDRPGRAHQPGGIGGSAVGEVVWQDQAEDRFLRQLAAKVDGLVQHKGAERIVVIASPRALGMLRPHLNPTASAAVVSEIPKDLTNFPVEQIERYLAA